MDGRLFASRYEVVDRIDEDLYRGRVVGAWGFRRDVALRLLASGGPEVRQRLAAAARLGHPVLVTPRDLITDGDDIVVVTDWVPGLSLERLIPHIAASEGRTPWMLAVATAIDLLLGLAAAHDAGLVHGRITPRTARAGPDGSVRLVGIERHGLPSAEPRRLRYMAPEQVWQGEVTPAGDCWSVGAILHELLTGAPAFAAETVEELELRLRVADAADLAELRPDVPRAIRDIVTRALHKEPTARFERARAMAEALGGKAPTGPRELADAVREAMGATAPKPPRAVEEIEPAGVEADAPKERAREPGPPSAAARREARRKRRKRSVPVGVPIGSAHLGLERKDRRRSLAGYAKPDRSAEPAGKVRSRPPPKPEVTLPRAAAPPLSIEATAALVMAAEDLGDSDPPIALTRVSRRPGERSSVPAAPTLPRAAPTPASDFARPPQPGSEARHAPHLEMTRLSPGDGEELEGEEPTRLSLTDLEPVGEEPDDATTVEDLEPDGPDPYDAGRISAPDLEDLERARRLSLPDAPEPTLSAEDIVAAPLEVEPEDGITRISASDLEPLADEDDPDVDEEPTRLSLTDLEPVPDD